jgi:putative MFS transporter
MILLKPILSVGNRLDRLPISRWHFRLLFLIGAGLFVDGIDNYIGSAVLSQLVEQGWSNNYLNATFISLTMLGLFLGSLFAGYAGDHYGRKFAYQINLLIFGLSAILGAFSVNMYMLIACRFLMGLGLGAEIIIGFGTFAEFIPARVRGRWASYLSLIGNFAGPFAMLLAYIIMPIWGWRIMFILGGVLAIIVWLLRRNMPESPRWCEVQGRYEEAECILVSIEKEIEKKEKIKLDKSINLPETISAGHYKSSWRDLFKGVMLSRTSVASACLIAMNTLLYTIVNWIPTIFVQQGISVTKSVGMMIMMMMGAPVGVLLSARFTDCFPRKYLAVGLLLLIAGVCHIYSLQTIDIFIMLSGFFMTALIYFYVCFSCSIYVPELFPTQIRMRGMGIANAIGRFTAVVSPYGVAWLLSNYDVATVFLALNIFVIVISLLILWLGVETRYESLENVVVESKNNKSNKYFIQFKMLFVNNKFFKKSKLY